MEETPADVKESEVTPEPPAESSPAEEKPEEKTVPYSRFQSVISEKKEMETRLAELESKKDSKTGLSPEEDKELQAKTYLKNLLGEVLAEKDSATKAEQKAFEKDVNAILDENPNEKKDDFLKFIEDNDAKYEFASPRAAFRIYKDFSKASEDAATKAKQGIASKPNMPPSGGSSGGTKSFEPSKYSSMYDVAKEIHKELKK